MPHLVFASQDTFKSSFNQAGSRMTTMEQRLAAFETFIAALPTWKSDLVRLRLWVVKRALQRS